MSGSSPITSSASIYGPRGVTTCTRSSPNYPLDLTHYWSRIGREQYVPDFSDHSLYLVDLCRSSYPEEIFGWNQRLACSISLSLLYPRLTHDLHVSTATSSYQGFSRPFPSPEQFTICLVLTRMLLLEPHSRSRSVAGVHIQALTSITLAGSTPKKLAHMLDPLVRVSRRLKRDHAVMNERQEPMNSNELSLQTLGV